MLRKALSLVTAAGILYVYLQSQLHSADALFLVTSPNLAVNGGLVAIAGGVVYVSFMEKFKSWQSYIICAVAAITLGLVGFLGFSFASFENNFSGALLPMDYMLIMQLGIILGICTLSYRHAPLPRRISVTDLLPSQLPSLKPLLTAWVPKTPIITVNKSHHSGPSTA